MSKLSVSLTPKYRLDIKIVRQGGVMFPKIKELRNIRRGSKISRLFRYIFEHRRVKQILGTNLAVAIVASTLMPQTSAANIEPEVAIISVQNSPITTERKVAYPVDEVIITQGFHIFHPGVDFDGLTGDPVRAIMKGKVIEIQYSRYAYGNAVLVDHGDGLTSLYAHLSKIEVKEGQEADTFTKLGEMGATGRAFGDHLHLEIRDEGRPINPLSILPALQ